MGLAVGMLEAKASSLHSNYSCHGKARFNWGEISNKLYIFLKKYPALAEVTQALFFDPKETKKFL